jgi:hypothetical protein
MGKRLYEMTVRELEAEAARYDQMGNEMWAQMCREQIDLNYRVAEAFRSDCAKPLDQGREP